MKYPRDIIASELARGSEPGICPSPRFLGKI
jgi:hypothetical protein